MWLYSTIKSCQANFYRYSMLMITVLSVVWYLGDPSYDFSITRKSNQKSSAVTGMEEQFFFLVTESFCSSMTPQLEHSEHLFIWNFVRRNFKIHLFFTARSFHQFCFVCWLMRLGNTILLRPLHPTVPVKVKLGQS